MQRAHLVRLVEEQLLELFAAGRLSGTTHTCIGQELSAVVLSESLGLANVENRVAVTSKTLFPINSATKSFTGVALMQLAAAGLVDLDAPASRYLDDLPADWRRALSRAATAAAYI